MVHHISKIVSWLVLLAVYLGVRNPSMAQTCPGRWLPAQQVPGLDGSIQCLTMWDPDGPGPQPPRVAAGGAFGVDDAVGIASRDPVSGQWSGIGLGVRGTFPFVYALASMPNGDLIAGGSFTSANGSIVNHVARWDGSNWSPLGAGTNNVVWCLAALPNGDVVAGGEFTAAGGSPANYIARWDGSQWSSLSSGTDGAVASLATLPNGDLLVGGNFSTAGGVTARGVARWDGLHWASLGDGLDTTGLGTRALAVLSNGQIVAGGETYPKVALWDGVTWAPLAPDQTEFFGLNTLTPLPNGDIVAGGPIQGPAPGIARWTDSAWHPMGAGADGPVLATVLLPNGDLAVGGSFNQAGGTSARAFAIYSFPSADFNNDGSPGTDADIAAFFSCLAGNCCPTCGSADFNGDGDTGTDADLESFFRVLAGGPC